MTYAYDNYIQLPTVDLYDTQTMAMAINAAKDMYDRGQQQIKDFYKEYGDFMSPFARDMEAYGNMVGGVRNLINTAYANGIDLLRSPEGRALISKAVYSVDPGEFNRMRTNAKLGFEYLSEIEKARAKGEFDQDYEDFLLRQAGLGPFDQFSSKMGMWNRPGPGVYQDVNKWTHHLFDNMELSYDPELSKQYPGFMAYTKSRDTMNQIVDNNIAGLLKTDLGKYRLQQLKDAGLSDEQAVSALKKMVVDSNYEENKVQLVQDPYAVLDYKDKLEARADARKYQQELNLLQEQARLGIGKGRTSSKSSGSGGTGSGKTPISYYEPMYQNLITNTINNDPHRTSTFGNNEFTTDFGSSIYQSQQNIAEDYFGDGTNKSIYGSNISSNSGHIGFDPKIKWENGNAVLDMRPTTKVGKQISIDINKTIKPDISSSDVFVRKFNDKYNDYLNRMSLDFESGMFANSWNHGESKVSEVTEDGKTIERLRGKNYVYMASEDVDKVYSGKELAARAAGATGKVLEDAIAETKRLRDSLKSGNNIMRGSGKMLGVGLYDTGQYGAYAKIHIANYDGNKLSREQDAYIMTPYQSAPNANFKNDGTFNLELDQTFDLSRQNMDNAAIRKLGVSSNSGTIDNTLPDPNPWYTLEGLNSFGWLDDDTE